MALNLNDDEIFVKHIIGITNLFSWVSQWKFVDGYEFKEKDSIFNFNIIMSQRFMLGFPLNKVMYGKNPFIAFQSAEYSWVECICWKKACICINEKRVYLVTEKIKTIYGDYIPAIAISIEFSSDEPLKLLKKHKDLSLKHLWYEDEIDEIENINNYENPILSPKVKDKIIPILSVESELEVLNDNDKTTKRTGDSNILDKLRRDYSIEVKDINNVSFIKGNGNFILTEDDKKFLSDFVKPIDFKKKKIRISVD